MALSREQRDRFLTDGYLRLPNFLSEGECDTLQRECRKLVDAMDPNEQKTIFGNDYSTAKNSYLKDDYFLTSGDKIRYFYEPEALDEEGNLMCDKHQSLNKIGHALHWLNPEFKKVTFSSNVQAIVRNLDMIDPVVIHSMYIFKHPHIGSEVTPHQDGTYLYCEPQDKVVGLWIALEDSTLENGCLWFIPGSQNEPIQRRMCRKYADGHTSMILSGPPIQYDDKKFVATPAKKGDLILIHGNVVHKSAPNTSEFPRPIYTFHILDQHESNFSDLNWIQPTSELPFTPLYLH